MSWNVLDFQRGVILSNIPQHIQNYSFEQKCLNISVAYCGLKLIVDTLPIIYLLSITVNNIHVIIFPREERLRQYLVTRYDSRHNIFDWDYNMKLSKKVRTNCINYIALSTVVSVLYKPVNSSADIWVEFQPSLLFDVLLFTGTLGDSRARSKSLNLHSSSNSFSCLVWNLFTLKHF